MTQRRSMLLATALVATLAASYWAAYLPEDDLAPLEGPARREPVKVASRSAPATPGLAAAIAVAPTPSATATARAERPVPVTDAPDLFASYSWTPPSPSRPQAPPPPRPQLPFTYGGRMEVDGKESFLLMEGLRTHIVAVGAEASGFRLESAAPSALTFFHPASGQRVALELKP